MKRIMKKALSFALVMMMVASLLPMTVFASEETLGTMETPDTTLAIDGTSSMISVESGATYYFSVLADSGEYDLTVMGATGFVVGTYEDMSPRPVQNNDVNGTVEVTVASTRGNYNTINFIITNETEERSSYIVTLSPAEAEGGDSGDDESFTEIGTYDAPVVLEELGTYDVSLGADDGMTFIKWTAEATGTLSITYSGMGMFEIYSVAGELMNPETTEAEVEEGDVVIIKGTGMPGATVNATFALETATGSSAILSVGTYETPFVLETLGTYKVSLGEGDGMTFIKWTAEEAGTLSVAYSGMGMLEIYSVAGELTNPETTEAEVEEGDVVIIKGTGMPGAIIDATFSLGEGDGTSSTNALILGENSVHVTVNNYFCAGTDVTFIATEAGTYVVYPAEGEENAELYVVDDEYYIESDEYPYEFTLAAGESITFNVCTSSVMTLTEDNIDIVIEKTASSEEGGSSNALVLGENSVHVTVNNYFCAGTDVTFTATVAGTYSISPAEGEENADITVVDGDWIEEYPYEFTLAAGESITFNVCTSAIMTLTEDDIDFVIEKIASGSGNQGTPDVEEGTDNEGEGTEEVPYVMIMGDNIAALKEADGYLYYVYTATEKGALLLTMSGDNTSWYYAGTVNGDNITQFINPNKTWDTNQNSSTDEEPAALRTIYLNAGDKVFLTVSTAQDETWTRPAGNVKFNAWFMAGAEPEGDEVVLEEYVVSDEVLELGENTVELDPSAETTIFEFCPEETGVYVFTTDAGVLGYWGAGSFFVSDYTGDDKEATLEYNLESVGPSIMVGVTGEGEVTITVKRASEAETGSTIPTIVYKNEVSPEASDEYEIELPSNVNINDDKKDVAVLGKDGYYHLNSEDGPVLFVNFGHETISLLQAYSYGRLNGVVKNEAGVITTIIDYNTAFAAYNDASNEDSCYPLTKDLMTILKEVGAAEGWYEEEGFVGGKYADEAWMFACCYNEEVTTIEEELVEAEKEDTNIVIKDSGKLTADSLETIIENATGDKVIFTVELGEQAVTFEFATDDFELIEGKETYDFSVELVTDYDAATKDDAAIEEDGFVVRVNFNYEGKLPGAATITIPVGEDYASKTLYYYKVMADGSLKYICDAPVDANGIAKVTQDSCSDYVLLKEKVEAPLTGDSTNVGLWFAVLALGAAAIAGSVVMRKKEF